MRHSPLLLIPTTLCFLLSSCATSSLRDAPPAPDQPWVADTNEHGSIIPRETSHRMNHRKGLALPPGYRLPTDYTLPRRDAPLNLPPDHTYSLPELIDIAQSSNPTTRVAWNAARDSALATGLTRAAYLPQLTASVVGGYAHLSTHVSGSPLRGSPRLSGEGEIQALSLSWLIFDFGKRAASLNAAEQNSLASNILFTGAHQKVIYDVTSAYYLAVAVSAHMHLIEQALKNTRAIERAVKARLLQGQASVIDEARAEQASAQAQLTLVRTRGELENRYFTLMTAMGISPSVRISLRQEADHALNVNDVRLTDQMVHDAVAQRPDVLAAYAKVHASQSQIKAAQAEFLPKVSLSGNAAYGVGHVSLSGLGSSPLSSNANGFGGMILGQITMPIFDGGMRQAQLKQRKDQADSAEAQLRDTRDQSVRSIVAAENTLHTEISTYQAAQKIEHTAQTAFDAALASYNTGEGSVTRLLDLQTSLFNATIMRSDSYYSTLIAAASLAFATGSLGDAHAVPNDNNSASYEPTPP